MVALSALVVLSVLSTAFSAPVPRALPTPVSVATAKTYLSELTVAVDSNVPAYSRDLFKTWDIISGTCDTRETVLKRDGTNVMTSTACAATSGNWVSPYDGVATTLSSDLDIVSPSVRAPPHHVVNLSKDHVVPLKEAWVSGARDWTNAQRESFANDLTRPQLVAVTDNLNESKGDKDPAGFIPPLASYVCTYIRAWITVKHFYDLTIDTAEKTALTKVIKSGIDSKQHPKSPQVTGPDGIATLLHRLGQPEVFEKLLDVEGTASFAFRMKPNDENESDLYIKREGSEVEIGLVPASSSDEAEPSPGIRYAIGDRAASSLYKTGLWLPQSSSDKVSGWGGIPALAGERGTALARKIWQTFHLMDCKKVGTSGRALVRVEWSNMTSSDRTKYDSWMVEFNEGVKRSNKEHKIEYEKLK
ncbi:hypothetical protein C8R43DRAFT_1130679 [Mycena crocata]|nr:hypothetical protein C8R43DRAFT_1130679 [Mycena crocata]